MASTSEPPAGRGDAAAAASQPPAAPPVPEHVPESSDVPLWTIIAAVVVGTFFIIGSLVNAAVTLVAPGAYADLGDWLGAPGPLDSLWHATMGDHPRVWVPIVGVAFELVAGLLCLSRRRRRRAVGLAGATVFHAGLLAMGLWEWAIPMTALLAWATVLTWRAPASTAAGD